MIKPTCDRKTKFWNGQLNTYGTLPGLCSEGGTCPGATTCAGGCWARIPGRKTHACYVDSLMRCYTGIRNILTHNTHLLKTSRFNWLDVEIERFVKAENKRQKPCLFYRLHWAGDIFSEAYAKQIAQTIHKNPAVRFWVYTRSFFAIPWLSHLPNLRLNVSLDPTNLEQGLYYIRANKDIVKEGNNVAAAYMSPINDFAKRMARVDQQLRMPFILKTCPVDIGAIELEYGCSRCQACIRVPSDKRLEVVWLKS